MAEMNLHADRWVVGIDYYQAPTCSSCHMSATQKQKVTHDVGQRISWTLRPPVSKLKEQWALKRGNMKDVCAACHGPDFVDGHYAQMDGVVNLYNEKFAKPAADIMKQVKAKGLMKNPASFSNKLEWIYWEVWHHEGRRARHGAAMMGPDYTWWHGIYEVAQHFYFKFLPEVRKYEDPEINKMIDDLLANDAMHTWLNRATEDLKDDIRSGAMQEKFSGFSDPEYRAP